LLHFDHKAHYVALHAVWRIICGAVRASKSGCHGNSVHLLAATFGKDCMGGVCLCAA